MKPDCWTCRWSIGCDYTTSWYYRRQGYKLGNGEFKDGYGLVCERRLIVAPTPAEDCYQSLTADASMADPGYEREPGSEG